MHYILLSIAVTEKRFTAGSDDSIKRITIYSPVLTRPFEKFSLDINWMN